jgi:DNA repair protein RadC
MDKSEAKKIELQSIPEISNNSVAYSSKEAHKVLKEFFNTDTINDQFEFKILFLNSDRKVIGVLDTKVLENSSQIVIARNSLGDDIKPTRLDYQATKTIKQSVELIGFKLLDNIILNSNDEYYSFADNMKL